MEVVVAQRMWQRRDTAAAWSSKNPTLEDGEIGVERDLPTTYIKFKIGDGARPWNSLPYFASGEVNMRVDSGYIQFFNGTAWENLIALSELEGPPGADGEEVELQVTATHVQWRIGAGAWQNLIALESLRGPAGPSASAMFGATFDGGSSEIAAGSECDLHLPYGCTLEKYTLLADAAGSIELDVRVDALGNYPPAAADSIVASAPPSLSGQASRQDVVLAGWSKVLASNSTVRVRVVSCSGIKRATLQLQGFRT